MHSGLNIQEPQSGIKVEPSGITWPGDIDNFRINKKLFSR